MTASGPDVLPKATLVILLGASTFPRCRLESNPAFSASARDLKTYFLSDQGFELPAVNLLDRFDSAKSPSEMLDDIADFLTERQESVADAQRPRFSDLLLYYTGHGGFTPRGDYFLALRSTRENHEGGTSLRMSDLATTIKECARPLRRFLILDCCFSAASFQEFQSAPLSAARLQTMNALPKEGTTLLCSSNARSVSIAPRGMRYTMFSGALIDVLRQGVPNCGPWLSMEQIGGSVRVLIRAQYRDDAVRPEVLSPDQTAEDIATVPIFPNKAHTDSEGVQRPFVTQHFPSVTPRSFHLSNWPSALLATLFQTARDTISLVVAAPLKTGAAMVAIVAGYMVLPTMRPPSATAPIARNTFIAVGVGSHRSWFGSSNAAHSPFGEAVKKILATATATAGSTLTVQDLGSSLRESVFVNSGGAETVYVASSLNATDEVVPSSGRLITSVISFNDDEGAYQFYKMLPVSATRLPFYSDGMGASLRQQLRDRAVTIGRANQPGDTIIVYIAGHGYTTDQALALSPYNVRFGSFLWNSIDLNEMRGFLDQLRFRRVFWLVDTGD